MDENDLQRTPGRRQPCCISIAWATRTGYIKRGYPWWRENKQIWIPWTLRVEGKGFIETSPIHFCPFCGTDLNKPEET